jgi:hypothetical protein
MNELDKLIRELEGADYYAYHEEPEPKYAWRYRLYYGWPAIVLSVGLVAAACAVWRHWHG